MPRATSRRQDTPLVELSSDSPHAGEPLGPQVVHDGPQVCRAVLRVRLDGSHCLLVANLLAPERTCAIGIAKLHAASLGQLARAALVRSLIRPASNSATEAIRVSRKRPMAKTDNAAIAILEILSSEARTVFKSCPLLMQKQK